MDEKTTLPYLTSSIETILTAEPDSSVAGLLTFIQLQGSESSKNIYGNMANIAQSNVG
jgi:hypothetical protein